MIEAKVNGTGFALILKGIKQLPDQVEQAGLVGLRRGLLFAAGVAQREGLSGPRPGKLDVRTTRLRNSIATSAEIEPGRGVVGRIGSNVVYAAFHEFGFTGTVNVKAHARVVEQFDAMGFAIDSRRVLRDTKSNFIGYKETRAQAAAKVAGGAVREQLVKAHTRTINYKGRPYVRPALERSMPAILGEINKEITLITPK